MRKKMAKVVKNSYSYFGVRIDIEHETDKLISEERFDECVYLKMMMLYLCLSIPILNVRYQYCFLYNNLKTTKYCKIAKKFF